MGTAGAVVLAFLTLTGCPPGAAPDETNGFTGASATFETDGLGFEDEAGFGGPDDFI